jgi:tetratricopeptide (TPR) repeat protein
LNENSQVIMKAISTIILLCFSISILTARETNAVKRLDPAIKDMFFKNGKNLQQTMTNLVITIPIENLPYPLDSAFVAFARSDYSKSIEFFDSTWTYLVLDDSMNGIINYFQSAAYLYLNQIDSAMAQLHLAIKQIGKMESGYSNLSYIYSLKHDFAAAYAYADTAIRIDPNYPEGWNNMAKSLIGQGRYDEALQCLDKAVFLDSTLEAAILNKGLIYFEQRKFQDAEESFRAILSRSDSFPQAWFRMAVIYMESNPDSALYFSNQALKYGYSCSECWFLRGIVLRSSNDPAGAMAAYDSALKCDPEDYRIWQNKASLLMDLKQYAEALKCCDTVLRINPGFYMAADLKRNILRIMGITK